MSECETDFGASVPDRFARLIQERVFGDLVKIPLEIRLWGGRTYRLGGAEQRRKMSRWRRRSAAYAGFRNRRMPT